MTTWTVLVLLWCSAWAANSLRLMRRGNTAIVHPVLLVTYVFLAAPLCYDIFLGIPDLSRYPGLQLGRTDPQTASVYLWYLASIFPLLYLSATVRSQHRVTFATDNSSYYLPPALRLICGLVLYAPLIAVLLAPDPAVYANYSISQLPNFGGAVADHHAIVSASVQASILAAVALVLSTKRISAAFICNILLALALGAWASGKRAIIAMIIGGLIFALWQRGILRGRRLIAVGAISLIGLGAYSVNYQFAFRGDIATAVSYEGFRIDYGRDSQIRMSIYAQQNPEQLRILPAHGTTVPLYLGQLVPRAIWVDKPLPYAQYFTSAVFQSPPQLWGWGMTTSWFDEWVSNLGVAGYLVAPLLLGILCRWANRARGALPRAALTVLLVLLVVLHVAAFSFLVPVALALVLWERVSRQKLGEDSATGVQGREERIGDN